jgi:hypothetical protein
MKDRTQHKKLATVVVLVIIMSSFFGGLALATETTESPNNVDVSTIETKALPEYGSGPILSTREVAVSSISPTVLTVTLSPGESVDETKLVGLTGVIPKADVMFSFDLTGSMGGELSIAQAQAIDIMTQLDAVIDDANYGVVSNLSLGCGYDAPEAYTRVFYESYADSRISWRSGAKKLLVNFADDIPHDNDLNEGIPGTSSIWSTGGDPGRNEIMDEISDPSMIGVGNDDLDLQDVLAGMAANNVILLEVHSSTYYEEYWRNWVARTGGGFFLIESSGAGLADAMVNLTSTSASEISDLSLVPTSGYESWVSTTPASYNNFTVPPEGETKSFAVTITVPAGTSPGVYNFKIKAIADGGEIGEQTVSITVPTGTGPVVSIDEDNFVEIGGTKSVPVYLTNGADIAGGSITIEFDPSTVTVDSVTAGDFSTPTVNIDNTAGTVKMAVAKLDAVGTNSATFANVVFTGEVMGSSLLDIKDSVLNDATGKLSTPMEDDGKITVCSCVGGLNGDLNGNGILDTGDATLLLRKVVGLD